MRLESFLKIILWLYFLSLNNLSYCQNSFNPEKVLIDNKGVRILDGAEVLYQTRASAMYWNPAFLVNVKGNTSINMISYSNTEENTFVGFSLKLDNFAFGFSHQYFGVNNDQENQKLTERYGLANLNMFNVAFGMNVLSLLNVGLATKFIPGSGKINLQEFKEANILLDGGLLIGAPDLLSLTYLGFGINYQNLGNNIVHYRDPWRYKRNVRFTLAGVKCFRDDDIGIAAALHYDLQKYAPQKNEQQLYFNFDCSLYDLVKFGLGIYKKELSYFVSVNLFSFHKNRIEFDLGQSTLAGSMQTGLTDVRLEKAIIESLKKQKPLFVKLTESKRDSCENVGSYTEALKFHYASEKISQMDHKTIENYFDRTNNSVHAEGYKVPKLNYGGLIARLEHKKEFKYSHFNRQQYLKKIDLFVWTYLKNQIDVKMAKTDYENNIEYKIRQKGLVEEYLKLAKDNETKQNFEESLNLYATALDTLTKIAYNGMLLDSIQMAIDRTKSLVSTKFNRDLKKIDSLKQEQKFQDALQLARKMVLVNRQDTLRQIEIIDSLNVDIKYQNGIYHQHQGDQKFKQYKYSESLEDYHKAILFFEKILDKKENARNRITRIKLTMARAKWQLADEALNQGDFATARSYYEEIEKSDLDYLKKETARQRIKILIPVIDGDRKLDQALTLRKYGKYNEAEQLYQAAVSIFKHANREPIEIWPVPVQNVLQKKLALWK